VDDSPRRPGRKPLDRSQALTVSVHLRVPAPQYDRVYRAAAAARISVPAYIRRQVERAADDDDDDGDR
jgi:hypothetical protein